MRVKLIGLGAAGNKAAICVVENKVLKAEDVMLINSTLKDIPADYKAKENCFEFTNSYGGCGKERSLSFDLCTASLQEDTFKLSKFLRAETTEEAELVVVVASTEGGTGSGAAPLMANYINSVFGIPVHIFGLAGFEDDIRGMKNTVDFFKDMTPEFSVECIKNSSYLPECGDNKFKAEKAANADFAKKISILAGLPLRDSEHNIDPTDLLKLSTTPQYMVIEYIPIGNDVRIKSKEQFKQILSDGIINSKAFEPGKPDQKRLGVIINIKPEYAEFIDYYSVLADKFGDNPYEKFEHIQHEKDMAQFVAFIATGMTLPIDEVEEVYDKYSKKMEGVNTGNSAAFFDMLGKKNTSSEKDDLFEHHGKKADTVTKDAFFRNMNKNKTGFQDTKTNLEVREKTMNEF